MRTLTTGLAALALAAAHPAHAEDTYAVLMKTLSNPFWGAMEQGVRDGAKEAGVEYFLQAVQNGLERVFISTA